MDGSLRLALSALLILAACGGEDGPGTTLTQTGSDTLPADGVSPGGADSGDAVGPVGSCWEGLEKCQGDGIVTCLAGAWSEPEPCPGGSCVDDACCEGDQCPCVADCGGRVCGGDDCGGSCGFCDAGLACADGACSCAPECSGKECGPDGCGGQCGLCQGDFECTEVGECAPAAYRAVLILDHWSTGCSGADSSGADIDAVALFGADGELISYFIEVIAEVGEADCDNDYTDAEVVVGPKQGTDDGCIALQGGWIMGRFQDYVPITSGMSVFVHEFGQQQGGTSEDFSVYLATGFDCAESDDPGACSVLISDQGHGPTEIAIP